MKVNFMTYKILRKMVEEDIYLYVFWEIYFPKKFLTNKQTWKNFSPILPGLNILNQKIL